MEGIFETLLSLLLLVLPIVLTFIVIYELVTPLIKSVRTAYVVEYTDIYTYALMNNPPYPTVVDIRVQSEPQLIESTQSMAYKRFFETGGIEYYEYYAFTYKGKTYLTRPNYFYTVDLATVNNYVLLSKKYELQYLKHRFGLLGTPFTMFTEYIGPIVIPPLQPYVNGYASTISQHVSLHPINEGKKIDVFNKVLLRPPIVYYSPIRPYAIKYNTNPKNTPNFLVNYAMGLPSQSDLDDNIFISGLSSGDYIYNNFLYGGGGTLVLDFGQSVMSSYMATVTLYNRFASTELKGYPPEGRLRITFSTITGVTNIDPSTDPVIHMRIYATQLNTMNYEGIRLPYMIKVDMDGYKLKLNDGTEMCVPIDTTQYQVKNEDKCTYTEYLVFGEADLLLTIALDEYVPDINRYYPREIKVMVTIFDGISKTYTIDLSDYNGYVKTLSIPISLKDILFMGVESSKNNWRNFYIITAKYNYNVPIRVNVLYTYIYNNKKYYVSVERSFIYSPRAVVKADTANTLALVSFVRDVKSMGSIIWHGLFG